MDTPSVTAPPGALQALGARLREARHERKMSQESLAKPEFTKSYVSAVERGKARPSLKALELMSRRLNLSMTDLLATPTSAEAAPDLGAINTYLSAALDQAELALNGDQAAEALRQINAAEQEFGAHLARLEPGTQYRLALLRATAYLRLAEPATARHELATAMTLAQQMEDGEAAEHVRNLTGMAFYQQEMPRLALEQHDQCLQAIRNGVVQDPSLRLSIYHNLANDHWALNEADQAISVYENAQELLQDVNNLARQTAIYRDLSTAQHTAGDAQRARRYAERALNITATARNLVTAAQLSANLAALRVGRQEYAEAEPLLARAQALLQSTGNNLLLSTVYEHYATLELGRGQLDRAAEYAKDSLRLGEEALHAQSRESDALARTQAIHAYVRALRISGLIEEQRGRPAAADALFSRALKHIDESVPAEIGVEIELTYADLLAARGTHEQASTHYRAAYRHRPRGSSR